MDFPGLFNDEYTSSALSVPPFHAIPEDFFSSFPSDELSPAEQNMNAHAHGVYLDADRDMTDTLVKSENHVTNPAHPLFSVELDDIDVGAKPISQPVPFLQLAAYGGDDSERKLADSTAGHMTVAGDSNRNISPASTASGGNDSEGDPGSGSEMNTSKAPARNLKRPRSVETFITENHPNIGGLAQFGGDEDDIADVLTEEEAGGAAAASGGGKTTDEENDDGEEEDGQGPKKKQRKEEEESEGVKEEPLSPEEEAAALAEKRRKHNLVESRRRKRVNQKFSILKKMTNAPKGDRGSILLSAIEKLQKFEQAQARDRQEIQRLRKQVLTTPGRRRRNIASVRDRNPMVDSPLYVQSPLSSGIDYHELFLRSGVAMAVMRIDGQFLDCNLAFESLSAYPREELTKTNIFALILPEYLPKMFMCVRMMLARQMQVCKIGKRMIGRGGFIFEVNCLVTVSDDNGNAPPPYFICLGPPPDVTSVSHVTSNLHNAPPHILQHLHTPPLQQLSPGPVPGQQQQQPSSSSGSSPGSPHPQYATAGGMGGSGVHHSHAASSSSSAAVTGGGHHMPGPGSSHSPSPSPTPLPLVDPSPHGGGGQKRGFFSRLPFLKRSNTLPTPSSFLS